jgi:hypothetical protein
MSIENSMIKNQNYQNMIDLYIDIYIYIIYIYAEINTYDKYIN